MLTSLVRILRPAAALAFIGALAGCPRPTAPTAPASPGPKTPSVSEPKTAPAPAPAPAPAAPAPAPAPAPAGDAP